MDAPLPFRLVMCLFLRDRKKGKLLFFSMCLLLLNLSSAGANTLSASFDDLPDGTYASSITDGGITFSNIYYDSTGDTGVAYVATTTDTGFGFSLPNYLTTGGEGFGSIYSMSISFSGIATNASLDIGAYGDPNESNTLTLEALNGTNIVATDTYSGFATNNYNDVFGLLSLSWSSGFTGMKLVVNLLDTNNSSPDYGNDFLTFGVDDVVVNNVPEPTSSGLMLVAFATVGLIFYKSFYKIKGYKGDMKFFRYLKFLI